MLFDPHSREVLFRQDVQFDESPPIVHFLAPETPLAPTTPSSCPLCFIDDEDDDHGNLDIAPPPDPP